VRKIKKLKIIPRYKDILRRALKTGIDFSQAGLASEAEQEEFISCLAAAAEPAVLFDFRDRAPACLPGASSPCSLAVVTLGKAIEDKISACGLSGQREAAGACARFLLEDECRLLFEIISQEPRADGFSAAGLIQLAGREQAFVPDMRPGLKDKTEIKTAASPQAACDFAELMQADKIGVSVCENGLFSPLYTAAFCALWKRKSSGRDKK